MEGEEIEGEEIGGEEIDEEETEEEFYETIKILSMCRSDEFLVEPENDSSPSHLDIEEENLELLSQTQQQQRADANAWRLTIAEAMWNDRPHNNENGNQEDNNENEEEYDDNNNI
ncbi:hypothetical protein LguiB_014837 [Lonicera macranthoides]